MSFRKPGIGTLKTLIGLILTDYFISDYLVLFCDICVLFLFRFMGEAIDLRAATNARTTQAYFTNIIVLTR